MRFSGRTVLLSGVFLLGVAQHSQADDQISIGVGIGPAYGGLGINVARIVTGNMHYGAIGCFAYSPDRSDTACGAAIGWISTNIFAPTMDKHGIGIHLGAVGSENTPTDITTVYGGGVTYTYFFRGLNSRGTNIGASIVAGEYQRGVKTELLIQVGHQF